MGVIKDSEKHKTQEKRRNKHRVSLMEQTETYDESKPKKEEKQEHNEIHHRKYYDYTQKERVDVQHGKNIYENMAYKIVGNTKLRELTEKENNLNSKK